MSSLEYVAKPYGVAVYEIAKESSSIQQWSESLCKLSQLCLDEKIKKLIFDPRVSNIVIIDILVSMLDDVSEELMIFLKVLSKNNRLNLLSDIYKIFSELKLVNENTVVAVVISFNELTEEYKNILISKLTKKFSKVITLDTKIDKSLLSGAIVKVNDYVIDGSLKNRMYRLSKSLLS